MEYDETLVRMTALLEDHPEGLTITQIAAKLGVHRNSISKYADVLQAAGRIEARQIGPAKLYTIAARIPINALLEVSHAAIILLKSDRTILSMNGVARTIETLTNIVDEIDNGIAIALTGVEWKADHRAGSETYAVTIVPVRFENGTQGVSIVLEDISEQRALESRLKLLDRAVAASSCGIVIADMLQDDAPLIYVNPAFEELTGYTASEVVGKNCRFLQAGKNPPERKIIREAIKNGTSCTVIIENYRKDGSRFSNELRLSPVRDDAGLVTHYVGVQTVVDEGNAPDHEPKSQ